MGDPLLNCWLMLWTSGQLLSFLSGDFGALGRYWHGNIFHPEPLTLAYSEHLTPQMLQALPVLAATDNVILSYNLVVMATFVLSGLGVFLLVRDLTGRPVAAFVAGLAFAFAPYRFDQLAHIQVLSSQWMPFVLLGFRRYLETGRRRALVGGAAALVAQNLSCGYFALFFLPFVIAYVLYELAARRRLGDLAAWRAFVVAGLFVAALTLPFFVPYLQVRDSGLGVRTLGEITMFSADVHAFATAPAQSWLWGDRLRAFPRPEGQTFPGFTILLLAAAAIVWGLLANSRRKGPPLPVWRQVLAGTLAVLLAASLYAILSVFITGTFEWPAGAGLMVWHHLGQTLSGAALLAVALAVVVRRRTIGRDDVSYSPWAFYAMAALVAGFLAMGPQISVGGTVVAAGPYAWLMDAVPGFDGLRVPARYVTLVTLFLAVLAGLGAAHILTAAKRFGTLLILTAGALLLVESWPAAFSTNGEPHVEGLSVPPRELHTGRRLPPIYKFIRDHEAGVVLLEFPFGNHAWDVRAVFYAGYHRKPLVNGYSGFFPESQQSLSRMLNRRDIDPAIAWRALLDAGTTHILVHTGAFLSGQPDDVTSWLLASGAREILTDGPDRLFTVR